MRKIRRLQPSSAPIKPVGLPIALLVAAWGTAHAVPTTSGFSLQSETAVVRSGQDVAFADLNSDGYLDAFVVNMNGQPNYVYLNTTPLGARTSRRFTLGRTGQS